MRLVTNAVYFFVVSAHLDDKNTCFLALHKATTLHNALIIMKTALVSVLAEKVQFPVFSPKFILLACVYITCINDI